MNVATSLMFLFGPFLLFFLVIWRSKMEFDTESLESQEWPQKIDCADKLRFRDLRYCGSRTKLNFSRRS